MHDQTKTRLIEENKRLREQLAEYQKTPARARDEMLKDKGFEEVHFDHVGQQIKEGE